MNKNNKKVLVIGGGGLLQPVFEPFWEVVLSSGLRFSAHGIGVNRMTGRGELNKALFEKIGEKAESFCCILQSGRSDGKLKGLT